MRARRALEVRRRRRRRRPGPSLSAPLCSLQQCSGPLPPLARAPLLLHVSPHASAQLLFQRGCGCPWHARAAPLPTSAPRPARPPLPLPSHPTPCPPCPLHTAPPGAQSTTTKKAVYGRVSQVRCRCVRTCAQRPPRTLPARAAAAPLLGRQGAQRGGAGMGSCSMPPLPPLLPCLPSARGPWRVCVRPWRPSHSQPLPPPPLTLCPRSLAPWWTWSLTARTTCPRS